MINKRMTDFTLFDKGYFYLFNDCLTVVICIMKPKQIPPSSSALLLTLLQTWDEYQVASPTSCAQCSDALCDSDCNQGVS